MSKSSLHQSKTNLKLHPEIGRAALAAGLAVPFRWWLLASQLNRNAGGPGWVDHKALLRAGRVFGLSRAQFKHAASFEANGLDASIFFTVDAIHDVVRLRSLQNVCDALRTLPGRPVYFSPKHLGSLETFKAQVYRHWFGDADRPKRISRANLCALWNVTDRTLVRWERVAGVVVNSIDVELPEHIDINKAPVPRSDDLTSDNFDRVYVFERNGKHYYRSVNQYHNPRFYSCRVGQSRKVKVNRTDLAADVSGGGASRVFFTKAHAERATDFVKGWALMETGETLTKRRVLDNGTSTRVRIERSQVFKLANVRPSWAGACYAC